MSQATNIPHRTLIALVTLAGMLSASAGADTCDPGAADNYLCGIPSAEDLVRVPGTTALIASAFAPGPAALNLIDARGKTWRTLYPSGDAAVDQDRERFADCPGPVPSDDITTHGLYMTGAAEGHATLYAVSHGARESIEVFDIAIGDTAAAVSATWIGCILTPDAQEANSVAVLDDGSLLATIPIEHGHAFAEAMEGVNTGAVWRWGSVDGWSRLDATEQPYPNGVEISADGQRFYIASSGLRSVITYSNATPAREITRSDTLDIIPDNIHRGDDGHMLTAGMLFDYPDCNPYNDAGEFDLAVFASCARPYQVVAFDPASSDLSTVAAGPASDVFSNITMAVLIDGELWVGTFGGDRVAYRRLP
jgi:hypothetical protein